MVQTRCGLTPPPPLSGAPPRVDSKQQMGMNMSSVSEKASLFAAVASAHVFINTDKNVRREEFTSST